MSDWQVGDLAVATENECHECAGGEGYIAAGTVCLVTGVRHEAEWTNPSLWVRGRIAPEGEGWCACGFRKIRPDEHEACEEEFVTLLNRTKRTVKA